MRTLRAISTFVLFSAVVICASAQSASVRFSSLPLDAQAGISDAVMRAVPGLGWNQLAKLTASDGQTNEQLGFSIAISGNTVVAGIPVTFQLAYVFEKPASGWTDMTQSAELTPSDGAGGFGYTVGVSGNTVVVGATEGSSAYVYVKPSHGWKNTTETAKLTATGSNGIYELAVSGNTVVVSSAYNGGNSYVFVKPKGGWKSTSQPDATLTTPFSGNFCQFCVGVSGNTIAVGTPGTFGTEGTVYVFVKPTDGWQGNLSPAATLVASNGSFGDQLGISVAVSGDTVVAGANGHSLSRGAVYVFVKPAGGWQNMSETARLTARGALELGWSVAVSGNTIVGGAFLTTVGANQFQGAAYVYTRPKNGWRSTHRFTAELSATDGQPNDEFGASVGVSGTTVVAGAPLALIGSNGSQGAAYVFGR